MNEGKSIGGNCRKNDECKTDSGLICVNNRCECMSNAYYSPGKSCGKLNNLFKLNLFLSTKIFSKEEDCE
jgi:hypothetical protein